MFGVSCGCRHREPSKVRSRQKSGDQNGDHRRGTAHPAMHGGRSRRIPRHHACPGRPRPLACFRCIGVLWQASARDALVAKRREAPAQADGPAFVATRVPGAVERGAPPSRALRGAVATARKRPLSARKARVTQQATPAKSSPSSIAWHLRRRMFGRGCLAGGTPVRGNRRRVEGAREHDRGESRAS
jgi:hypothetical protein